MTQITTTCFHHNRNSETISSFFRHNMIVKLRTCMCSPNNKQYSVTLTDSSECTNKQKILVRVPVQTQITQFWDTKAHQHLKTKHKSQPPIYRQQQNSLNSSHLQWIKIREATNYFQLKALIVSYQEHFHYHHNDKITHRQVISNHLLEKKNTSWEFMYSEKFKLESWTSKISNLDNSNITNNKTTSNYPRRRI